MATRWAEEVRGHLARLGWTQTRAAEYLTAHGVSATQTRLSRWLTEDEKRRRLPDIQTAEDALAILRAAKKDSWAT